MLVHVARLAQHPGTDHPAEALEALADRSAASVHNLTESPGDADVILYTQCHLLGDDWRLETIRRDPLAQQYPHKVMVYDERDRPWCAFRGVYVSMPAPWFDAATQRASSYYTVLDPPPDRDPDLLFSFIASNTARCRSVLFGLRHPDAIVEEAKGFTFYDPSATDHAARRERFRDTLARSRFVLCPRGGGTSSIRMYEAMAAGRVPVVISDQWVPPAGPDWTACSLRWPEGRTDGLVDMLEDHAGNWKAMGDAARHAYETQFGPAVSFDRIATLCEDILRGGRETPRKGRRDGAYLRVGARMTARRLKATARSASSRLPSRTGR